ncbi:uncharacterized protein LOC125237856 [Leguminivora glycinivorella]|uniref:uncharacterized protein LOC125237856 n=1 Tax=Leguminivora glycinivorella TaxID=1035111 RepID=UPI00200E17C6|nr:uncharacterized protein LOC125237856 [Leguminivora glycinivorella]
MLIIWTIIFFFNTAHGLKHRLQHPIATPFIYDVDQKLSSQELKTNNKIAAEVLTKNYFTKLTPIENAFIEETKPKINGIRYNYSNLVLTTAINVFDKEIATLDLTQNYTTDNLRRSLNEAKLIKKRLFTYPYLHTLLREFTDRYEKSEYNNYQDFTRSESESGEISFEENYHRVHTPARRIFHGHKTKIHHFPFLVAVHVLGRFVCGGSIITSDLVITAAHCLKSLKTAGF